MAKKNKKLSGVSGFYNNILKETVKGQPEVIFREAFLRAVRDTTDNFGIDRYSLERVQGMVEVMEQFVLVREELDE
jgi:Mg2+/Co2+ transporter CorC